jgi:hypothetical protein
MGENAVDVVPVVSRANIRQMTGFLRLSDILSTYGIAQKSAVEAVK